MKKKLLSLLFLALFVASILIITSCGGPKYIVTFDPAGGTLAGEATIEVTEGDKIPQPENPTKEGYIFSGWFASKSKDSKWDFENDVVTGDVKLTAWWSGGNTCEHQMVEFTDPSYTYAPTCKLDGLSTQRCVLCGLQMSTPIPALDHDKIEVTIDPTCSEDGYSYKYCQREGCGWVGSRNKINTNRPAHDWSEFETVIGYSYYIPGSEKKTCGACGAVQTFRIPPMCEMEPERLWELGNQIGNYIYTGGKYSDGACFVNTKEYAGTSATSYYSVCSSNRAIDGDMSTYWCAGTLADGASFKGDEFVIDFNQARDIGAIKLFVPMYYSWDLGENCYVAYDVYAKVDGKYQKVTTISDKTAVSNGVYGVIFEELDAPVCADALKFVVAHSTRYTPATIYEIDILAKTEETERVSVSLGTSATINISGRRNEYAGGAENLTDGDFNTGWQTDYRIKAKENPDHEVFAEYDFSGDKFIAAIQFCIGTASNKTFSLYYMENEEWVKIGSYSISRGATTTCSEGGEFILGGSRCVFTATLEKVTSKIKLVADEEKAEWDNYVYSYDVYTIEEIAFGLPIYMGCNHASAKKTNTIAPTCTTAGYTEYTCQGCGLVMKSDTIDATGHTWGPYTVTTAATATSSGTKTSACTTCGQKRESMYTDKYEAPTITTYLNNAPAAWSMVFDDGNYLSTYDFVGPKLKEYGFKATAVLTVSMMQGYVSNWKQYFASGVFDLGSHSYNHSPIYSGSAINKYSAIVEVENAHFWLMSKFPGQRLLTFATPNGTTSPQAAEYITGIMAAGRHGDQGGNYNRVEDLTSKKAWGNLNSYNSKITQTEGPFVFVEVNDKNESKFDTSKTYKYVTDDPEIDPSTGEQKVDDKGNPVYKAPYYALVTGSYKSADKDSKNFVENASGDYIMVKNPNGFYKFLKKESIGQNFVYDATTNRVINQPELTGTYFYNAAEYKYEWKEVGSYDKNGDTYTFRNDNNGKYRLLHPELGSFEDGINILLDGTQGTWTVECLHGVIESDQPIGYITISYAAFISKCEYLKKAGVWCGSFTEVTQYLQEAQTATVKTISLTDTEIKLSLTDTLDDTMYNFPLTIKVDIPDAWTDITATQNGKVLEYFIEDGYAYVNAVPDCGEIIVKAK
ncbi:MAG: InlB B-repeat-containing protein [Clostridia bacterium]|nr:InlB B-repeat-containing protein [Clostridia bacterium]